MNNEQAPSLEKDTSNNPERVIKEPKDDPEDPDYMENPERLDLWLEEIKRKDNEQSGEDDVDNSGNGVGTP